MRPLFPALLGAVACAASAAAQPLHEADSLYLQGLFTESMDVLNALGDTDRETADAYVLIAENQFRLQNQGAALAFADAALELAPCHSGAHNLLAALDGLQPWDADSREQAWAHVQRAVECDPENGNAWLTYWISGVVCRDGAAQALAQRRIAEIGFIPGPVMEQGRWMLRSAPPNAVLFTNGDWDFFPMMVAQSQEGLRPDVTIAMLGMLEVPWYVRELAERVGWPVPPEAVAEGSDDWGTAAEHYGVLGTRSGALWARTSLQGGRPLAFAATAPRDIAGDAGWIRWHGPVYTLLPRDQAPYSDDVPRIDEVAFAASMRHLDLARLRGPVVHPTDRSPIRRAATHPAQFILLPVIYHGNQSLEAGRMADARQALAWADALIATGQTSDEYTDYVAELRTAVETDGP